MAWLEWLFGWLKQGGSELRSDFITLKDAYNDLMSNYQKMNLELREQVESLANEVANLRAGLEAEKEAHKECRRKLREHEQEIESLKVQVSILVQRDEQRLTDGENKHGTA